MVKVNFPAELIEIASTYDEDMNGNTNNPTHLLTKEDI